MKARSPRRQDHVLGMLDEPVVLGMEHVVDSGQADVLVGAAVAGDEVRVEQLVVVFGVAVARIAQADGDVAVGDLADRHGIVGDVGEESTGRAQCARRARRRDRHWLERIALNNDIVGGVGHAVGTDSGDQLREAVGAGNEVAVGVGPEQRHAADVGVGELDAQNVCRLGLDLAPVGHAAVGPLDELAGRNRRRRR